jgi:septum formation protein
VSARSLILASASPARLATLRSAGLAPEVIVSGVPEDGVDGLPPAEAVRTLALRKATAVASGLAAHPSPGAASTDGALVLGCDSLLAIGGEVRGKPASAEEAWGWWRDQRGRTGTFVTGHAVVDTGTGAQVAGVSETVVRFGRPTDAEIDAYVASGEPLAVAGAFTLDGRGAPFVAGIDGDPGTVIGLSLPLLRDLLAELGVSITDLWDAP